MDEKKEYFKSDERVDFEEKNKRHIEEMSLDSGFKKLSKEWAASALKHEYTHHFTWLGLPIIQLPQDIVALQEIIWKVKPDIIFETGIARGGSLIFNASLLEMIGGNGKVIGVDISLRESNREAIIKHPLSKRITILDGSSVSKEIYDKVCSMANGKKTIVILDSNHSHEHALKEMILYEKLIRKGSYLVVLDTWIEDFHAGFFKDRPWDKGNNSATAVGEFLKQNKRFKNDTSVVNKLGITCSPYGYLECIKDLPEI